MFPEIGFTLAVLEPGKPTGMYHAEFEQEKFLVLAGECLLLVEEEERPLRAWDLVHCPPGTRHTFVGTGDEPCVIFMTGERREDGSIVYPLSKTALSHGAGVETETPEGGLRPGSRTGSWAARSRGAGSAGVDGTQATTAVAHATTPLPQSQPATSSS